MSKSKKRPPNYVFLQNYLPFWKVEIKNPIFYYYAFELFGILYLMYEFVQQINFKHFSFYFLNHCFLFKI